MLVSSRSTCVSQIGRAVFQALKLIPLSRGLHAKVDDEDFPVLSRHSWCAQPSGNKFYAVTQFTMPNGARRLVHMHHFILGTWTRVDHISGESLDYQKTNLRRCTTQQNNWNKRKGPKRLGKKTSSQYKGVCREGKRYRAAIMKNRVLYRLGYFDTEEEAARAYDAKAKELFGEFACLNFPA